MKLKDSGWLEKLIKALKNWKEHATTYGSDSDGSKAHGSDVMTLLFENAQHLDEYQRKFGASTISQQHILHFVSNADRFTSMEIKGMGGKDDYLAFCEDGFLIADFEKWQKNKAEADPPRDLEPKKVTGVRDRFKFAPGQVLFDDIDLGIRASSKVILQMLVDKFGQTVTNDKINENPDVRLDPNSLPHAITHIRKALRSYNVPCEIVSVQNEGYLIRQMKQSQTTNKSKAKAAGVRKKRARKRS